MNRTRICNQVLFPAAILLIAAVGRATAQDDESTQATDPLPGASARPVMRGTAIDSARARYEEADQLVRQRAESLRKLSLGSDAGRNQKSVAGANWILLQEAVARAFKARQELLRLEIVEFETRLEKLKGRLTDRERSQQTIIDRRVEELLDPSLR